MISKFFKMEDGILGFGLDEEDIASNLYLNKCKKDMSFDITGIYAMRRAELFPWNPRPNMLHLDSIGCLIFDGVYLTESNTGNKVLVNVNKNSPYYYVSKLLGNRVTYSDITLVMKAELDTVLQSTGLDIVKLDDMPNIIVSTTELGFDPKVVYRYESDVMVAIGDNALGLKYSWSEAYYVVERKSGEPILPLLDYLGYRAGIIFTYSGQIQIIEEESDNGESNN